MKISSADSQARAPGRFQLMGIQNRTKEEIHTLEIFPRILMEETLQPQPETGMVGKSIHKLETWKLVKGIEFIQKGFILLVNIEDSEKRFQEKLRICPSSGSGEEEAAYTEKLEEELREEIIEQIHPEQVEWFNPIFIIPKPHLKQMKILDASALNKEIQTFHFNKNGTDQMRDLIRKGDWATSLDLKLAFHYLIVYPPHRPYLAFEAIRKVYQYRAMPFETQHSPIIFAQALAMVLTKKRIIQTQEFQITQTICSSYIRTKKDCENKHRQQCKFWKHLDGQQLRRNAKQNQNNRLTSYDGHGTWKGCKQR
ncbi:MAG: hypothetical protein EZS28_048296 [Streblomastix strix]|uniref:Reverse transcriptase domain-containing protein n=1 Tax=Streblomastix strix TaxID=222440 RepID=A0A5J4TDB2_9EUKA|nr:MAG: hypothetical protein EZS28_048296 [Streblomastix strix]